MFSVLAILSSRVVYGKERSNIEVYHLLKKYGCNVTVLVNSKVEERIYPLLIDLNVIQIEFPNRHEKSFLMWKYFGSLLFKNWEIYKIIKSKKPDVLFLNNEIDFYDLFFSIKSFRGRILYRIGDAPAFPKLRFNRYNSYVWNYMMTRITRCVYISYFIKNKVAECGRINNEDIVIYNYPPTRVLKNKDDCKIVNSTNLNKNIVVFGYIGQVSESKGVDLYLNAARKLLDNGYDCYFYVAGSLCYDEEFGNLIKTMVQNDNRIILLGEIDDINAFYENIDILCVPSVKEEPLGNVIVEAKKYHRPCVIFPSGGMPELIDHMKDGYICSSKTESALYEGMEYYVRNVEIIEEQKIRSFESISKLGIDRESFESRWFGVFKDLEIV